MSAVRERPSKRFRLAVNKEPMRDKDNAFPQPKPPLHLDQPRLAPPGMAGIRPRLPQPQRETPQPEKRPARIFKPLVVGGQSKVRDPER